MSGRNILANQVALVTGAARGIGAAIVEAMIDEGASVMITDVLAVRGEALADAICRRGGTASFHALDVREPAQWQAAVAATISAYGQLDILVNNAGITRPASIEEATLDEARLLMDVNYFGTFVGMQTALPFLKASVNASVVNISSNSTRQIVAEAAVYSPSKAAVANLSQVVAIDWAHRGYAIRVNTIHPGPHATDMLLQGREDEPSLARDIAATIPLGRLGQPVDIANAVVFLASERAAYITGAQIFVDGGVTPS